MAHHLAFRQMDLTDSDLPALARAVFVSNEATVEGLLREAIDAGEVEGVDPAALAPMLLTVAQGALLAWAVYQKGARGRGFGVTSTRRCGRILHRR